MNIEIKNVSKSFGKKQVLKNISLNAIEGDMLCLLGPSGAGKTTIIRLITGAISADEGEIFIGGKRIPNMEILKHIGFMPQSDALYTDISGYDNLLFFGRFFGLKGSALKKSAEKILSFVNLFEDKDKLVINYSGGMKKRLSLAIALMHNPEVLVLDEPTVGIDPVLKKTIWDEFEDLRQKGTTLIISTHVMDEAEKCRMAALIYDGRLIAFDEVKKLIDSSKSGKLEELFFTANKGGEGA